MFKNDKIYRIVSVCNFLLHIFVFVFVVIIAFLPYREKQNFYECFVGFFDERLSTIQPYIVMAILLLSCVMAFLVIKRPWLSMLILISSSSFFVIATLPYSIEAMIIGFASPWIGGSMATYGIGFKLIVAVSYIVYFDIAFFVYSVITLFIRAKRNPLRWQ